MKHTLKNIFIIQAVIFLCLINLFEEISAQSKTKELGLKLQVKSETQKKSQTNFDSAIFFILKRDPATMLREMNLEDSFLAEPLEKNQKVSDELYLKAAALILIEADDNYLSTNGYLTGWGYNYIEKEVDEDISILSFLITDKFSKHLITEIKFDNLFWKRTVKIPIQQFHLYGFCRIDDEIIVWNTSISTDSTEMKLNRDNAKLIFKEADFVDEIDNL